MASSSNSAIFPNTLGSYGLGSGMSISATASHGSYQLWEQIQQQYGYVSNQLSHQATKRPEPKPLTGENVAWLEDRIRQIRVKLK